jgi:glycerol uptake facilitator-like aquaporin
VKFNLRARLVAEFLGTAFLVAAVVGSGIMAERLSGGNVGLALLANTTATGAALVALIFTFGPISGAHLNPVVSLADALEGGLSWRETLAYIPAQLVGGLAGTLMAHAMFGLPLISLSRHARSGPAQMFSEFVATFGLLSVIWGCSRSRPAIVPFAVASYISAAYVCRDPSQRRSSLCYLPIGGRTRRYSALSTTGSEFALVCCQRRAAAWL